MTVTWGVEFEYYWHPERSLGVRRYVHIRNWDYQTDPTAGTEIRSPVFHASDLAEAAEEIQRQFSYWKRRTGVVPVMYPVTRRFRSQGMHIHIGKEFGLSFSKVRKLADAIKPFYPLFIAIAIQDKRRLLYSGYSDIYEGGDEIESHYCELSASHHGTLEMRAIDSNIPQVALTVAKLATHIAEKTLEEDVKPIHIPHRYYLALRSSVIEAESPEPLPVESMLYTILSNYGDIEFSIPAVKQIIALALLYRLNAGKIVRSLRQRYRYFDRQTDDVMHFIENLTSRVARRLELARILAEQSRTLKDMLTTYRIGGRIIWSNLALLCKRTVRSKKVLKQVIQATLDISNNRAARLAKGAFLAMKADSREEAKEILRQHLWNNVEVVASILLPVETKPIVDRVRNLNMWEDVARIAGRTVTQLREDEARYYAYVKNDEILGILAARRIADYEAEITYVWIKEGRLDQAIILRKLIEFSEQESRRRIMRGRISRRWKGIFESLGMFEIYDSGFYIEIARR